MHTSIRLYLLPRVLYVFTSVSSAFESPVSSVLFNVFVLAKAVHCFLFVPLRGENSLHRRDVKTRVPRVRGCEEPKKNPDTQAIQPRGVMWVWFKVKHHHRNRAQHDSEYS